MKIRMFGIALLVFILVGVAIFMQTLIRQEQKTSLRDMLNNGSRLVSLIALHPVRDFEARRRDFIIKTLIESAFRHDILYCFINDRNGKLLVALSPGQIEAEIPTQIQTNSLAAMGLLHQQFKPVGSELNIHEFAKPIFENAEKTGTVRIGLKEPFVSIISMERITLTAILAFFILSAAIIAYYGLVKALKPIERFLGDKLDTPECSAAVMGNTSKNFGIEPMMEMFKTSIEVFQDRQEKIETQNRELTSRLGVLRFEKKKILNVLNSINMGIIIIDTQDNVGYINDYTLKLLNKARQDLIDRPLAEVLQHEEIHSFITRQQNFEQPSGNYLETTFSDLVPEETYRVSCSDLMDGDKALIGKIITFDNITREKENARAVQAFTAQLSHELMTPLTTIKSYSEMLMDGEVKDNETQKEFYNTINGETARLTLLIRDLLNLSKIEMGSLLLNQERVKSDGLFEDCITAVEGSARKKNISIQRDLPDNPPTLVGDKEQLKGVLINILGNAVKYTPENGKIHFALSEEDNMVIFDIRDTGYGIAKEDISRIFDKFYRSSNQQIVEQQGTGLGLAIASEIVSLHEGEIKVQSEIGRGTEFKVKIPKKEFYLGKE